MLVQGWASIVDGEPKLVQHLVFDGMCSGFVIEPFGFKLVIRRPVCCSISRHA